MKPEEMTIEKAISIVHPDTAPYVLAEIECYHGFSGHEASNKALDDARLIACAAMEKQMPKKPVVENGVEVCPSCYSDYIMDDYGMIYNHCVDCGQALDWSDT